MSLTKTELMDIPANQFGIPEEKKFPMQDEKHLKSAISYFWSADKTKRKSLAANIIRRYKELNSTIKVNKKNPLYEYLPANMKNFQESSMFENVKDIYPLLDSVGVGIVETLMTKTGIDTVDDIDSQVPDSYTNKKFLVGTLKSFILNEDVDFPVLYTDFHITSQDLNSNNGGIKRIQESILLKYDNSLNESAELIPLKNFEHIQFAALLREWTENYENGHRNLVYDRLMIESWHSRIIELLQEVDIDVLALSNADKEAKQKMDDLGIKDPEEYEKTYVAKGGIADNSPIEMAANIAAKLTDDIKDRYASASDDPMVLQNSIGITLYTGKTNAVIQKDHDIMSQDEKYRW
jgi:hypothetical protein